MRSSFRLPRASCAVALVASSAVAVAAESGETNFHLAGWPTMTLFSTLAFLALSVHFGRQRGGEDWKGTGSLLPRSFLILNALNAFIGIFLTFGPGAPGPRANVVGYQLLVAAAIGFYCFYTSLKAVTKAVFVISLVNILSILGCMPLMSHSAGLFDVSNSDCLGYFAPSSGKLNRCDDSGYLQLVRTFALFALAFLTVQMSQAFLAVTDGARLVPNTGADVPESRAPLMPTFATEERYTAPTFDQAAVLPPAQKQAQAAAPSSYAVPVAEGTGGQGYQAL